MVTSVTLQADLAKEKGVRVDDATIRKFLKSRAYSWMARSQKRKYTIPQRKARVKFAKKVLRLSVAQLKKKLDLSLDGVILSMPPSEPTERFNYVWGGETFMWRKRGEANLPALAGAWEYKKQVPLARAIPLWGGISEHGAAAVMWHPTHKTNQDQWYQAVKEGKLTGAIRAINPGKRSGPYTVLCDGESFLHAKKLLPLYERQKVNLWQCPPKSPDLNPIELFWGWLRRKLRRMDLADLRAKRAPLSKLSYVQRVKSVIRTATAQRVAKKFAKRLRTSCKQVVARSGAAADN